MLTAKQLLWLGLVSLILGVLIVAHLYTLVPHGKKPFAKALEQVTQINLSQGPAQLTLVRSSDTWTVQVGTEPAHPVEADRIHTVLNALPDVELDDVISDRPERQADFEVTIASGTLVILRGPQQTVLAQGIFGKQAPDFTHIYFRYPDETNVYLARGLIRGELGGTTVAEWRSRDIVNAAEPDFQKIEVQKTGSASYVLEKSSNDWTLDGKRIDPTLVYVLTGALAHLRADDYLSDRDTAAMSFHDAKITFTTTRGTSTLEFGPLDARKRRPGIIAGDSEAFVISDAKAQALWPQRSAFKTK